MCFSYANGTNGAIYGHHEFDTFTGHLSLSNTLLVLFARRVDQTRSGCIGNSTLFELWKVSDESKQGNMAAVHNAYRYQLRHFNELDHELKMRLNRSYKAAMQYMDMFISSIGELFAKNIAFVAGSFFAVLIILSAWDEDVLQV